MKAGRLRDRIRLERFATVIDATGSPAKAWTVVAERAAEIRFVSGREYFAAGSDVSESTVRITIREIPDLGGRLDGELRAIDVDKGDVFDITAVLPSISGADVVLAAKMGGGRDA